MISLKGEVIEGRGKMMYGINYHSVSIDSSYGDHIICHYYCVKGLHVKYYQDDFEAGKATVIGRCDRTCVEEERVPNCVEYLVDDFLDERPKAVKKSIRRHRRKIGITPRNRF